MKNKLLLVGLLVLSPCGCTGMNNTQQGAVSGGLLGAGAGALIGGVTRNAGAGALIGGLAGTAVGAAVGNDRDRFEDRQHARAIAAANTAARNQLRLEDIVQMAQRQTPDDIIIRQIDQTQSIFALSTQDIFYLQDNGVSRGVISFMQSRRTPRTVVVAEPAPVVVHPQPVYVVEPAPPPIGVGVVIGGRGYRRW